MKDKFLMVGLFFLLMATLPLVIFGKNVRTSPTKNSKADKTVQTSAATPDEVAATSYAMTEEAAAASVASLCKSDTCDEAVRALCILCKTNLEAGAEVAGGGTVTDSELLERVRAIYDSNNEILTDAGQPVAVPSVMCSNGVTEKSAEYPALEAVASPWDAFEKETDRTAGSVGVSIRGVCYLCSQGMTAEEALQWYLPKLQIS